MKFIRWILGKVLLTLDWIFSPTALVRPSEEQAKVDNALAGLALYEFEACPFCIKVRRFLKASGVRIPLRDAKTDPFRAELLKGGGKLQAPCLQITKPDGSVQWMYESKDIISYLSSKISA